MKFTAKLKGFQSYTDLEAKLTNKSGKKVIGIVSEEDEFDGKFVFKFSKKDLPGKKKNKKSNLKLTIESLNTANETNLTSANVDFTFDPIKQSDRFKISRSKNKSSKSFSVLGESIAQPTDPDTTPPAFTSASKVDSVKEGTPQETVIYTAEATDASTPITYSLSGNDAADFKIDPQTGIITTKTDLNHSEKNNYDFNVVATDSEGNSATLNLSLGILPGGISVSKVAGKDLLPDNPLTEFSDTINCPIGSLELNSIIQDGSTKDKDIATIDSDSRANLEDIIPRTLFTNIEEFQIKADSDESIEISLKSIVKGSSLKVEEGSTFKAATKFTDWHQSAITDFDFSGITSIFGIRLLNADSGTPESKSTLRLVGSAGPDTIEGLAGDAEIFGNLGADILTGSTGGKSTITGGAGLDIINFPKTNIQNTINLTRQTTSDSLDTVTGFIGANNATKANGSFDVIQVNDGSFPNYEAGAAIQQKTVTEAGAASSLKNTVIVDTEARIKAQIFPNELTGLLAFATDTRTLHFAPTGNFPANTQDLLQLDTDVFSASDQIAVVSGEAA
ncbi:cadherin repeat domain-containing protein [Synechococcus sp. CC9616]|uniref:cadherin repeat domain-containing protein n=1 Tax=Synechococcus sp. CC9616 TaxID=110663 RepID=UPI00048F4978|nr:cadherin repeat domain-containing protein [Synechococcus sp. CC9616]